MRPHACSLPAFELLGVAWLLGSILTLWPQTTIAESLLSLPHNDILERLDEPEARPRTRKAQVLYPAQGLPSFAAPGDEVVVRVRVRRAMTPPPGIQQYHVLMGWSARLVGRFAIAADGTSGTVEIPLQVYQIRPEDLGFVYRVRLKVPPFTPPGLYDLEFDGPGIRDRRPRAVRILEPEAAELTLVTVASGSDLWREAEGLMLTNPTAVLVPGGLTEATSVLERFPLATLAVPGPDEIGACRMLRLSREEADAIASELECTDNTQLTPQENLAHCVVESLGGARSLDRCGDELSNYGRRIGPPSWALRLGEVSILGLDSLDRHSWSRARMVVKLGSDTSRFPAPRDAASPSIEAVQREWLAREASFSRGLVILSHHAFSDYSSQLSTAAKALEGRRFLTISSQSRSLSAGDTGSGPAVVHLKRIELPPARPPLQPSGYARGRYRLGKITPRPRLEPALLSTRRGPDNEITVDIEHPPAERIELDFLLPATPRGWSIASKGRKASIRAVRPAAGNLCELKQLLLSVEIEPGTNQKTSVTVQPSTSSQPLELDLPEPESIVVLGRPIPFRGDTKSTEDLVIFWDFGDDSFGEGAQTRHRYIRSGPTIVCATAMDPGDGRTRSARLELDVQRWGAGMLPRLVNVSATTAGWGVMILAVISLLMASVRGNIFARRRRLR